MPWMKESAKTKNGNTKQRRTDKMETDILYLYAGYKVIDEHENIDSSFISVETAQHSQFDLIWFDMSINIFYISVKFKC